MRPILIFMWHVIVFFNLWKINDISYKDQLSFSLKGIINAKWEQTLPLRNSCNVKGAAYLELVGGIL